MSDRRRVMYKKFSACEKVLANVKPVNFFLTNQLMIALKVEELAQPYHSVVYHLLLALSESLGEGHTCLKLSQMAGVKLWENTLDNQSDEIQCEGFRFPNEQVLEEAVNCLLLTSDRQPVVFDSGRIYLRKYWQFETHVASKINDMVERNYSVDAVLAKSILSDLFATCTPGQNDHQRLAVANALNKAFVVIAGGPGTGKTSTVAKLLVALQQMHNNSLRIGMAAPTGKAAQRLNESLIKSKGDIAQSCHVDSDCLNSIPTNASTIQRLLGVKRESHNFRHDEKNQLDLDVLLIDEVSMVDLPMMARVLRAVPDNCRLILLGDADQLASVEAGSVLTDIAPRKQQGYSQSNVDYLQSLTNDEVVVNPQGIDHLSLLTFSHRFKGDNGIGKLANAVIKGHLTECEELVIRGDEEVTPITQQKYDDWLSRLVEIHFQPIFTARDHQSAFDILNGFKILSALRQGEFGVQGINQKIEEILHTKRYINSANGWYKGKPVMITQNDYRLNLFNGDIGLLWPDETGQLFAVFPTVVDEKGVQQYRWLSPSRLPSHDTVYAMTIHKTQGSEFHTLAVVLPEKDIPLLTRELLYTGITRAKQSLMFFGSKSVLLSGVAKKTIRHSGLQSRLFNITVGS